MDRVLEVVVALERAALDRWIKLDPDGYLGVYAHELTYFDPFTDQRVDDLDAMRQRLAPMKSAKLPFTNPRYEMTNPKVQVHGDIVVLTFNLVNYGTMPDRQERVVTRWNSTEVYSRSGGSWQIIHSHWSFIKPEVKQPGS